jgi:hypothetical protein
MKSSTRCFSLPLRMPSILRGWCGRSVPLAGWRAPSIEGLHPSRSEGIGLGLSIVRRTAGLLGHHIDVRSAPGEGSCFQIEVPSGS